MKKFNWANNEARQFLSRGYLDEGQSVEERVREIADNFEKLSGIEGIGDKFYEYMSNGWYSLSSPVWSNYGNNKGFPVSCFGSYIEDSMESIMYTHAEVGMLSKFGGGTSGFIGNIRPRGSEISGKGKSTGSVHFMEMFDKLTNVVSQGSVRRGFFTPYLPIDHDDFDEFVGFGNDEHPIQTLTNAVTVSDDFIKEMLNGNKEYQRRWAAVLKNRSEVGYPYIFFTDNVNKAAPDVYKDKNMKIHASNMCVTGDTKILTDKGHIPIQSLVNQDVNIWNGFEWSKVTPRKTGENKEVVEVEFSNGQSLKCTKYHKFHLSDKTVIEAKDLKHGDKILKHELPVINFKKKLKNPYIQGFYSGDGCFVNRDNKPRIYLYEEKRNLLSNFEGKYNTKSVQSNRTYFYVDNEIEHYEKDYVPLDIRVEDKLAWLAGILDSDGTIIKNKNKDGSYSGSLSISSIDKSFLLNIQLMLQTLGVSSKINLLRKSGVTDFNDGYGEYQTKDCYRMIISSINSFKLYDMGMKTHRIDYLNQIKRPNRKVERYITVKSINDNQEIADTYCFNEPKNHTGIFNGILTGQCSEIALSSNEDESFVCVLSSMNLLYYDDWKETDAVQVLTIFLDTVVTEFLQKIEKEPETTRYLLRRVYNFAKNQRALGLGVLGWHTLLLSKNMPFESRDAAKLNLEVFKYLHKETNEASKWMAKEWGEPELLEGYGRRNATLMAIAPTKSSSFILGQMSMGIEMEFSNYYTKDLAKARVVYKNPYLEKTLEKYGKNDEETWNSIKSYDGSVQHLDFLTDHEKDVYRTIFEVDPMAIINQAAVRQEYIDQAQSLNLMVDPKTPAKEIHNMYMEAWKLGVKTLYYQYSLSAAQSYAREKAKREGCVACEG